LNKRLFKAKTSTALMFVFVCIIDVKPTANTQEMEEIHFFNLEEVKPLISKGKVSIGLEQEFTTLQQIEIQKI
jgi:hypothetical protein